MVIRAFCPNLLIVVVIETPFTTIVFELTSKDSVNAMLLGFGPVGATIIL